MTHRVVKRYNKQIQQFSRVRMERRNDDECHSLSNDLPSIEYHPSLAAAAAAHDWRSSRRNRTPARTSLACPWSTAAILFISLGGKEEKLVWSHVDARWLYIWGRGKAFVRSTVSRVVCIPWWHEWPWSITSQSGGVETVILVLRPRGLGSTRLGHSFH
jgi:hypothetical protein